MKPRRIVILAFDQVNLLDISGPAQVFTEANHASAAMHNQYEVIVASQNGGLIDTSSGIGITSVSLIEAAAQPVHTLLIAGGAGIQGAIKQSTIMDWIKQITATANRTGSVCTGAFMLAASGRLNGCRAVTHWQYTDELQTNFPQVRVETDPIYIQQDNIWTSAGVTAGIDLALALVEQDLGHTVALKAARALVVFIKRPGGQKQYSSMLQIQANSKDGKFTPLHHWINENIGQDLTVEILAEKANMSPRNFSRVYTRNTGLTPAKAIEEIRVEAAQRALEDSSMNLSEIGRLCGFGTVERLRKTFIRHLGVSPQKYRMRFVSPNH